MPRVSPERISLVLSSKGLETASIAQYKAALNAAPPAGHDELDGHLRVIATQKGDVLASTEWAMAFTSIAMGKPVDWELSGFLAEFSAAATNAPAHAAPPPKKHHAPLPPQAPMQEPSHNERPHKGASAPVVGARTPEAIRRADKPQVRAFGKQGALTFELDANSKGFATVSVDGARSVAVREYDWTNKVSFQLTRLELPHFTALVAGYIEPGHIVDFNAHGPNKTKNLHCKDVGDALHFKLNDADVVISVRVDLQVAYHLLSLCVKALLINDPHLDSQTALQLCRRTVART